MPPFLTKRALRESGLIVDADDRLLGTCPALPSFHLAYAREAEKMSNLMASVPDEPAPPRCQSCALVSNAGILRKRECVCPLPARSAPVASPPETAALCLPPKGTARPSMRTSACGE